MNTMIVLSPEIYALVQQYAQQSHTTPTALVETAVRSYLFEQDTAWQHAFLALIERVHTYTRAYDPQDIEADITAAALEAKDLRYAHRGSD